MLSIETIIHTLGDSMLLAFRSTVMLLLCLAPLRAERPIPPLVSTQWLAEHLNEKDLVVLQVGFNRSEYKMGHIPNSRFLWFNAFAPSTPDLSTEMPSLDEGKKVLEELGISSDSKIVLVYSANNVTITTRMFLALAYFGFEERTALLDGGFEMWKREGREITAEMPVVKKSSLSIAPQRSVITDADWVKAHLNDPAIAIVDARTRNFYDGTGGGISRQGHIRGARHLVFNSVLDTLGRIKPHSELQRLFDSAGVSRKATVVSYCHVGQQATLVYFAARILGYDAKVYDGCFEDWNVRDETYPVDKKPEEKSQNDAAAIGAAYYACPPCGCAGDTKRHPKPGNCPDCGMAMIAKK